MQKAQNDAILLVNNMAGLSTQLNESYMKFITRIIDENGLQSEILEILKKGKYSETLVDSIIKELDIRLQLREKISRILNGNDFSPLTSDQLLLDANNRINVPQTIKRYFLEHPTKLNRNIMSCCAIFGFTEFLSEHYNILESNFFDERDRNQCLNVMFYLSALHGNLEFMNRVWELAVSYGIEKNLICSDNYSAVAAGRASNNPQILGAITSYAKKLGVLSDIPEYTDDQMFPLYAHANNVSALHACWKKPRSPQAYLMLLTDNNCVAFDSREEEMHEETREILINQLIALNKSDRINIPDNIWSDYFSIVVRKGNLPLVRKIWESLENESLKKSILDQAIVEAGDLYHMNILKFIIEQAESFSDNPLSPFVIEAIETMRSDSNCPNEIKQIFSKSTLLPAPPSITQ